MTDSAVSVAFTGDGAHLIIGQSRSGPLVTMWRRLDLITEACKHVPADTTYAELAKFSPDGFHDFCKNPNLIAPE